MSFKEVSIKKNINIMRQEDKHFREAWDDSRNEYELIHTIVRLRNEKNYTQRELAELTGCSQQEISRFENRGHSPKLSTICKIVNNLGYKLVLTKLNA